MKLRGTEFPNGSQRWFPKEGVEAHTRGHTSPSSPGTLLSCWGTREEKELHGTGTCRNCDKGRNLKGKCGITELALVTLHSWQQPDKIPLSPSIFKQNFRYLYKCEIKEIGNIYSGGKKEKKSKRRFCKMPSVTLISSGESPRPDFLFLNGAGSQKSF